MKEKNPLIVFFAGIILLGAGLYWLFNSVDVSAIGFGFGYSFRLGGTSIPSGLTVVPLIVAIFWWVIKPDSFGPKVLFVLGLVIIIAAIIMSVTLRFRTRTLYEYILMLAMIVSGAGLLARVLLAGNSGNSNSKSK